MSALLNPVETFVSIAGKPCHFRYLKLHQKFNHHHCFDIEVDFEELESQWMDNPTRIIQLMGKEVNISMKHKITGETNDFLGLVTHVEMIGKHGQQSGILVSGHSPTIRLDGKKTMDSFMDKPLKMIVDEAVGNSGNGASVTANPKFGGKADYLCQYNETCFEFLNRLSWLYGEWFGYSGTEIFFGNPGAGSTSVLTYDEEILEFNLSANLVPPRFNRYEYLVHDDNEIDSAAPDHVPGVRGYIQAALNQSKEIYTSEADLHLNSSILMKEELYHLVKMEKSRSVGDMLVFNGKSHSCKVKIGGVVSVALPGTMAVANKQVEDFLVTEVTHIVDQESHYFNTFKGVLSGIENIPMPELRMPVAAPQVATVKTNDDEKKLGRVKVEFQWQKKKGKTTNWIRVQTPDAGKSDKVANNRGYVAIPEEKDIVMVGFEYNDPNRPFVMGSIFSEKVSQGGGQGNKSKSITTRSGSTMTLDDDKGSILIKDQHGSDSKITFDGKKKIKIEADDELTIDIGKGASVLKMDKNGNITINGNVFKINATKNILLISKDKAMLWGKKAVNILSELLNVAASKKTTVSGGGGIIVEEKGFVDIN